MQERRGTTNLGEIRVLSSVVVLVYEVYLNNTMLDGMLDVQISTYLVHKWSQPSLL